MEVDYIKASARPQIWPRLAWRGPQSEASVGEGRRGAGARGRVRVRAVGDGEAATIYGDSAAEP